MVDFLYSSACTWGKEQRIINKLTDFNDTVLLFGYFSIGNRISPGRNNTQMHRDKGTSRRAREGRVFLVTKQSRRSEEQVLVFLRFCKR